MQKMQKNKITILFVIAILLFVSLNCAAVKEFTKAVDKNAEPKNVTSIDNKVQLTIPASWNTSKDLHNEAILGVMQPLNELYTIILPTDKKEIGDIFDLDAVTEAVRKDSATTISDATYSETIDLKVNGFEAKQFEAVGVVDNLKISYIFTFIETPENYYQVVAWTLTSDFAENKPILLKVINSFKLLNGSGKIKPTPPPPSSPPPPKLKSKD